MRLEYCGGETRWSTASDFDGGTPDEVVDAVLVVEGLDPTLVHPRQRSRIRAVVIDWLCDPQRERRALRLAALSGLAQLPRRERGRVDVN